MADVKKGDAVKWKSAGGTAHGEVVRTLKSDTSIKGQKIKASSDDPKLLVETDEGKRAAHKPGAVKKD